MEGYLLRGKLKRAERVSKPYKGCIILVEKVSYIFIFLICINKRVTVAFSCYLFVFSSV